VTGRGTLRVYLGAAPGVGKTFAMLSEAQRARERGADVVVGFVETHGRPKTAEQIAGLEVVPRRSIEYRGTVFEEMDVDAVLARRPERALVDELAHTNVPGSRNPKRWQDVEELLDAGIDVITTVNIQHLESLNDVVTQITGVTQRETIPDAVVRAAEQVELVDQTPEALRRRMAHGNIYGPEKIDAALANYFRVGNLTALRELALLWLADRVDDELEDYRARHGISSPWETRERVVVALTGAPGREHLIRRASRIAQRAHGELVGVHVQRDDGLSGPAHEHIDRHRELLTELGGSYRATTGTDIAAALVAFARRENATQIVLGATSRSRWQELTQGSIINRVIRLSGPIDVHVISQEADPDGSRLALPRLPSRSLLAQLPPRRRTIAFLMAAAGLPLVTVALTTVRDSVGLPSVLLIYLIAVLIIGAVGGALPALVAAVSAFLLANFYFTPPLYRFTVGEGENLLALVVFILAASLVSYLVDIAARRKEELTRVRVEAEAMARMAGSLTQEDVLPRLVEQVRTTFGAAGVAVLQFRGDAWRVEASAGEPVPAEPGDAEVAEPLGPDRVLVVDGAALEPEDDRLLHALTAQAAFVLEARRLQGEAARATELAQANDLRAGLLQAVSHDLRTPLASIKASITSLRQTDVAWGAAQQAEFFATIEDETDRLTGLVEALLDMSRLQAGVLTPVVRETSLEEVLPGALADLGPRAKAVEVDVPPELPTVDADPQLLARVVANLVDNALTYSEGAEAPQLHAGAVGDQVLVRVVDRGPGIDPKAREDVFLPFQRVVDHGTGVGLGLAIARGFTEAMGGELSIEDTPGGGTTMVVTLHQHQEVTAS
jgi:two-component system, OmpR family, sensor histidine kinase KdpD